MPVWGMSPGCVKVQVTVSVASGSGSVTSAASVIVVKPSSPALSIGPSAPRCSRRSMCRRSCVHSVRHGNVDLVAAPGELAGWIAHVLVGRRVSVEARRGRRHDLAVKLEEDGRRRAVAPVDRHRVRAERVRIGELTVQGDRVALVGDRGDRLRSAAVNCGATLLTVTFADA